MNQRVIFFDFFRELAIKTAVNFPQKEKNPYKIISGSLIGCKIKIDSKNDVQIGTSFSLMRKAFFDFGMKIDARLTGGINLFHLQIDCQNRCQFPAKTRKTPATQGFFKCQFCCQNVCQNGFCTFKVNPLIK